VDVNTLIYNAFVVAGGLTLWLYQRSVYNDIRRDFAALREDFRADRRGINGSGEPTRCPACGNRI
jgi:hypothetical protein